jgi:hypothetical protein
MTGTGCPFETRQQRDIFDDQGTVEVQNDQAFSSTLTNGLD